MSNDMLLSEATFEQIAAEINSRSRDFLVVSTSVDGSHGRHSLLYYGNIYGALGLAAFAKAFLMTNLMDSPSQPTESSEEIEGEIDEDDLEED